MMHQHGRKPSGLNRQVTALTYGDVVGIRQVELLTSCAYLEHNSAIKAHTCFDSLVSALGYGIVKLWARVRSYVAPYICHSIWFGIMIAPNDFYRSLADETRLRCLVLLAAEGELCVCELTHAIDTIQPKISRHLATLRNAGLVIDRKWGQWVFYSINPDLPGWARTVLQSTAAGVNGLNPFVEDRKSLHAMDNRPGRCGVSVHDASLGSAATFLNITGQRKEEAAICGGNLG